VVVAIAAFVIAAADAELELLADHVNAVPVQLNLNGVDAVAGHRIAVGSVIPHFVQRRFHQAGPPGVPVAGERAVHRHAHLQNLRRRGHIEIALDVVQRRAGHDLKDRRPHIAGQGHQDILLHHRGVAEQGHPMQIRLAFHHIGDGHDRRAHLALATLRLTGRFSLVIKVVEYLAILHAVLDLVKLIVQLFADRGHHRVGGAVDRGEALTNHGFGAHLFGCAKVP